MRKLRTSEDEESYIRSYTQKIVKPGQKSIFIGL